jgi:hypothetical protein
MQDNGVDAITDEMVQHELQEDVFQWRGIQSTPNALSPGPKTLCVGKNKQGMLCCVITGRMLDAEQREGTYSSFKKFLIRIVEQGLQQADQVPTLRHGCYG